MHVDRQIKAADSLENLAILTKEVIRLLRQGQSDGKAYALIYELRKRMSSVVSGMGRSGIPESNDRSYANEILDSQLWHHDT